MTSILTERLILEPLSIKHCSDNYLNWLNDPEVYKYLETRGGQTMKMLEQFILDHQKKGTFIWAIKIKDSQSHIGNIKVDPVNFRHGLGEYGILMGDKKEWGKGYAKEATKAILDYFFTNPNPLRKITLGVVEANVAAVALYKKLGFIREGVYKNHLYYDGVYHDVIRMAIFNPEYHG